MHPSLSAHRAAVAALCQLSGVKRLELFGSAARDDFDPGHSDFDFLVEFVDSDHGDPLQNYFGLKEALERLLGRPVDLVMPAAVKNPYILASINRDRQLVYGP